jgi:6-phosphogluconolactonase
MEIFIHDDSAGVARTVAGRVADVIDDGPGRVNIGLTGGSTPAAAYELLRSKSGWSEVDAWLSDERWVGPDHERSNGAQAASLLMDHVPARFYRPSWGEDMTPDESAAAYERTLVDIYGGRRPDLILLGMGSDGHVASLFPETDAIEETERLYVANHVPQLDEDRLTATYPLLWMARLIVVMVTGSSKAPALAECLQGDQPGGMLGDGDATVEWHVDREAASLV